MNVVQLRNRFRQDFDDLDLDPADQSDLLVDDDLVNQYMEEAYQQYVAETFYYPTVLELDVVDGQADIALPDTFLETRGPRGYLVTADRAVYQQDMDTHQVVDDYGVRVFSPGFTSTETGTPRAFSLDIEFNTLRLFPTPDADDTLQLPIFSRPPTLDFTDPTETFVITQSMHVRHLLLGMKALAYMNHDADVYDRRLGELYQRQFEDKIAEVYSERMRRRRKPQEVHYGGIPF